MSNGFLEVFRRFIYNWFQFKALLFNIFISINLLVFPNISRIYTPFYNGCRKTNEMIHIQNAKKHYTLFVNIPQTGQRHNTSYCVIQVLWNFHSSYICCWSWNVFCYFLWFWTDGMTVVWFYVWPVCRRTGGNLQLFSLPEQIRNLSSQPGNHYKVP